MWCHDRHYQYFNSRFNSREQDEGSERRSEVRISNELTLSPYAFFLRDRRIYSRPFVGTHNTEIEFLSEALEAVLIVACSSCS